MALVGFTALVLFVLILPHVSSQEPELELSFKAKHSKFEMGFCLGLDSLAVYRSTLAGDQLLGNSSDRNTPDDVPADLQGRIQINNHHNLLGLQILNLTAVDSGTYRWECWKNQALYKQQRHHLIVCNEEIESEEIIVKEDGRAEVLCKSPLLGLEGTSFHWYYEIYPNYKLALLLDSSVSLTPLGEEQQGVVEVSDRGARLVVDESMFKKNQNLYCLVINGTDCLSFQNMYPPDRSEAIEIFASQGDKVVLDCPAEGHNQQWDTPLGIVTSSNVSSEEMHVPPEAGSFSLVIPAVSDKHSGEYLCSSSTSHLEYTMTLCPMEEHPDKLAHENGTISVKCGLDQNYSHIVKWLRHEPSGQDVLIFDSRDDVVAAPEDLRGRVTVSEDGSSLTISGLKTTDGGAYWCVVLRSLPFLHEVEDDGYDDEEEEAEDDDYSDDDYVLDINSCLSKQATKLTVTDSRSVPGTVSTVIPVTPAESSNVAAIAAGGGLVGLLVIGAVVTGIVLKRRSSAKQRQTEHLRAELQRDRSCTERLNPPDDA